MDKSYKSRRGKEAKRLTRDHKSSDPEEQKRIQDFGGIILHGKVAGNKFGCEIHIR